MATDVSALYRRYLDRPESLMVAALTAAAITLIAAAVIGGRQAQGSTSELAAAAGPESSETIDYDDLVGGPAVGPEATAGTGGRGTGAAAVQGPARIIEETGERISEVGATREGVHKDHFEFGLHGPLTFDGVPLNLADDPVTGIKGYITYINRAGGINGLKVRVFIEDDRYTTQGGQQSADKLVKEIKPFFISGTLGIDQIAKVTKAAAAASPPIPYMAGGGPQPEFKDVGMFQILANYDQYADMVVAFVCKFGPAYVGGSKADDVRLGTTTLNSENILPVEKRLVSKLEERKCVKTPVEDKARGTIQKPTEQASYGGQMIDLRTAYGNQGANLIIPLQDPVSTSRQVLEWSKSGYRPKWNIANFAHDGDTSLALFQGEWTGMRVMSGSCYYHPQGGGDPYNASKCAQMGEAHRQFVSLGQVTFDENAGGSAGGRSSYNYNEDGWTADGSGAAFGYQVVYFWNGAMTAIGTDPTREKFIAALLAYDNYSNLVTSPITFKGSANPMIGATKFVLLEGQSNLKYREVTEITPGLVDQF